MSNVAKMYVDMIWIGVKTLEDVPEVIKEEVEELLQEKEQTKQQQASE